MKIEHLIVQHLYNSKQVSLEDIGTFTLSPNVILNPEDKDATLPENAITFEYQPKAQRDEALVNFIVQHSRKIKPLATSDLESYSILGREYLNIGKPFIIEGLGTLYKTQFGTYQFTQGTTINPKLEAQAAYLKEKDDHVIDFSSPSRKTSSGKSGVLVLVLVLVAFSAAAIIYFIKRDSKPPTELTEVNDSPAVVKNVPLPLTTDTLQRDSSSLVTDSFNVVVKKYLNRDAAVAFTKLNSSGNNLQVIARDSSYFVVMPFTTPIADSSIAKDSVSRTYGVPAYILQ